MPTIANPFRHVERPQCDFAEATLAAVINPSTETSPRESHRVGTRAAMLREFHRAGAPERASQAEAFGAMDDFPVVAAHGILMSDSLERIQDPEAVADTVAQIIAKHRAEAR